MQPHGLEGLRYHYAGLPVEDHYTDTASFTDFGLCRLFGFRFATRMRDIGNENFVPAPRPERAEILKQIVSGAIDSEHITAYSDVLLRLAVSAPPPPLHPLS